MSKYRNYLPQMDGDFFLTDGGLEKALVFRDGIELPHFAAFVLMKKRGPRGRGTGLAQRSTAREWPERA